MNKEQTQPLEQKIINLIGKVLITPNNYGPVTMTFIFWLYSCYFGYNANHNFDLITTVQSYIIYSSLVGVVIGMLSQREYLGYITRLGLLTQILAIFALLAFKQLDKVTCVFAIYILVSLSMFCFLLLIKNIWLVSMVGEENNNFFDDEQV